MSWPAGSSTGPAARPGPDNLLGMRYLVREQLFSIGGDSWITDDQGNKVFLADGKALSLHGTFELKDASGAVLAVIRKKLLSFTDTMEIERDGAVAATVHRQVLSLLHHRTTIDIPGRGRLEAAGNIVDKDFEIRDGDQVVGQVSRAWFRIRDSYGVDVAPGEDDALIICIAICLDRIHHGGG
jgi:uncharacterized protein YxjI